MDTFYSRELRRVVPWAALLLLAFSAVRGQDSQPAEIIKVYANLVSVPVIVSDRDGRYISRVTAGGFQTLRQQRTADTHVF